MIRTIGEIFVGTSFFLGGLVGCLRKNKQNIRECEEFLLLFSMHVYDSDIHR